MSALHDVVADYLTIRRALGFKLTDHEWMLVDFASYLEQAGASTITTESALAWARPTRPAHAATKSGLTPRPSPPNSEETQQARSRSVGALAAAHRA